MSWVPTGLGLNISDVLWVALTSFQFFSLLIPRVLHILLYPPEIEVLGFVDAHSFIDIEGERGM